MKQVLIVTNSRDKLCKISEDDWNNLQVYQTCREEVNKLWNSMMRIEISLEEFEAFAKFPSETMFDLFQKLKKAGLQSPDLGIKWQKVE